MTGNTIRIFVTAMFAILLLSCESEPSRSPKAEKGILNLRGYDFTGNGNIPLDGQWNFCWRELLPPSDMCRKSGGYYTVPGSWQIPENEKKGADGYGTLSLLIQKDRTEVPLALKIPSISSSYKLWVNEKLICTNGTVSESAEHTLPIWLPRVVTLPDTDGEEIRLILQISNFHDRRDGFWGSIIMGSSDNINRIRDKSIAFELFIFGSLFIMALYHFSLYALRRNDKSTLYFAILCLLLAARTISGGECFLTLVTALPSLVVYKILFIAFFLLIPTVIMYFLNLYPDEVWGKLRIAAIIFLLLSIMMSFMPLKIITESVIFFELASLILFIYFTICLIRAVINHREGAVIFLTGWLIFCATGINDILFDMGFIWTGLITPFGLLFFIFSQAFLLSMRYANAFRTITLMSERLMSLDILKDEFLANTSHELKTPLNGIIGLAGSLIDGARGELYEDVKSDLMMVVTSGKRLASLINDILDFSKLNNRDLVLLLSPVDIKSIIDSVIHISRSLLKSNEIILINNIKNDLPLIYADENRLQQVFYNIIGNAIKFTESGGIAINAVLASLDNRQMISISVSDTGIGIDNDKLETIFESFQQADGSISRKYGGTGIGLSITRQLVNLHGGSIDVKSEPGIGSTFTVLLPLKSIDNHFSGDELTEKSHVLSLSENSRYNSWEEPGEIQNSNHSPKPVIERKKIRGKRSERKFTVLIVDDDPVNLQVLENYLSLENYIIKKTRSGFDAIEIVENDKTIDIVLLDIMMPRVTGYDVAKRIREKFTHVELPIIMLTAKNQITDLVAGIESGANDYLSKPFDNRELLVRVDNLLMLKESLRESIKLAGIELELNIARKIQFSTMPSATPEFKSMQIAVRYIPMATIGGDFYSFHVLSDDSIGILLTDVTGHGIPAALIASMLKIVSNMLVDYAKMPDRFLSEMNRILTGNMGSQLLTAIYVFIDAENRRCLYSNAGHEPVIVFKRKEGAIIEENPRGKIIGWLKDADIELSSFNLDDEDRIILFTDCITEAFNDKKEMFGIESLKRAILKTGEMDAEECAGYLISVLEDWTGKKETFDDDFSLIVIDMK